MTPSDTSGSRAFVRAQSRARLRSAPAVRAGNRHPDTIRAVVFGPLDTFDCHAEAAAKADSNHYISFPCRTRKMHCTTGAGGGDDGQSGNSQVILHVFDQRAAMSLPSSSVRSA